MSQPLSAREKRLASIVAIIVFVFANVWLIDWTWKEINRLRASSADHARQLKLMRTLTADLAFWEQRDAWIKATQPSVSNADLAAVELLEQVKQLARKHSVLLENPSMRVPDRKPEHVAVVVEIETKSAWKPLIDFLHEVQQPAQFIAVESANLKIDNTDPTQMRGRFRIARWYAPNPDLKLSR